MCSRPVLTYPNGARVLSPMSAIYEMASRLHATPRPTTATKDAQAESRPRLG